MEINKCYHTLQRDFPFFTIFFFSVFCCIDAGHSQECNIWIDSLSVRAEEQNRRVRVEYSLKQEGCFDSAFNMAVVASKGLQHERLRKWGLPGFLLDRLFAGESIEQTWVFDLPNWGSGVYEIVLYADVDRFMRPWERTYDDNTASARITVGTMDTDAELKEYESWLRRARLEKLLEVHEIVDGNTLVLHAKKIKSEGESIEEIERYVKNLYGRIFVKFASLSNRRLHEVMVRIDSRGQSTFIEYGQNGFRTRSFSRPVYFMLSDHLLIPFSDVKDTLVGETPDFDGSASLRTIRFAVDEWFKEDAEEYWTREQQYGVLEVQALMRKKVILEGNYWEDLDLFICCQSLHDTQQSVRIFLDGRYSTGLGRPPKEDYEDMEIEYGQELKDYLSKFASYLEVKLRGGSP